ncbi:MAG: hypothetical protein OXE84_13760 [Rhodobacteraceae bacterium]|nr:hypothetical protein [Paracoccaceae bacterium]
MRKLSLLAAAVMVAGGSAFAMDGGGVSISGSANFGVKFAESDDDSKSELQFHHEFDVKFSASGTTDGGIGFGGSMSIDNTESVSGNKATAAKTGYIVTADDKTADLNARFGFDTKDLKAGDVIISGSKANLSGYEKATIASHNVAVAATPTTVDKEVGDTVGRPVQTIVAIADGNPDGRTTAAVIRGAGVNLIRFTRTVDGEDRTEYVWTTQDVTAVNGTDNVDEAVILATGLMSVAQTAPVAAVDPLPALPAIDGMIQIASITEGTNAPTDADKQAGALVTTRTTPATTRARNWSSRWRVPKPTLTACPHRLPLPTSRRSTIMVRSISQWICIS